ncbi:MAG: hypothetical protein WC273_04975 [Dehalococcoidia bacterium]
MLTLADLVRNRTMSTGMAATLALAAEERRSMLFVAIPRLAGKSTVMQAALQYAPPGTPMHRLSRGAGPGLGIPAAGGGGYLVVAEVSPAGFEEYLWGAEVRRVFAALGSGFSLATALHAGGADQAFEVLTAQNGVPDDQAARVDLVTYIRSVGPWHRPSRRVVSQILEINGVVDGLPEARLLHRWSEPDDHFVDVEPPLRVGTRAGTLERYRAEFDTLEPR